jgi:DNA-binding response OmpR family regulator
MWASALQADGCVPVARFYDVAWHRNAAGQAPSHKVLRAMGNNTILVSDPDTAVAAYMAEVLGAAGYTVHRHPNRRLTADAIEYAQPGVVITECRSPQHDIVALLEQLRRGDTSQEFSVIVSMTDPQMQRDLAAPLQSHGCGILLKPFDLDELLESVAGAFRQHCRTPAARV